MGKADFMSIKNLSIDTITASTQELINVPTTKPIDYVKYILQETDDNLADIDTFSEEFDSIRLLFDGKEQYSITNYAELLAVMWENYREKPEIVVQRDTDTSTVDNKYMSFKLPVKWESGVSSVVTIEINYASTVTHTNGNRLVRAFYREAPNWNERLQFRSRQLDSSSVSITHNLKPDKGKIVRAGWLYASDNSALTPSTIRYPISAYGGNLGYAEISIILDDFEPVLRQTEEDILSLMDEHFGVELPKDNVTAQQLDYYYPLNYAQDHSTSTDGEPVVTAEGILRIDFHDIIATDNTELRVLTSSSNWTTSDTVTIYWCYVVPKAEKQADTA